MYDLASFRCCRLVVVFPSRTANNSPIALKCYNQGHFAPQAIIKEKLSTKFTRKLQGMSLSVAEEIYLKPIKKVRTTRIFPSG